MAQAITCRAFGAGEPESFRTGGVAGGSGRHTGGTDIMAGGNCLGLDNHEHQEQINRRA